MQGRSRGNVAAERLCGALFVGLTTLKGYFYTNLGGTLSVYDLPAIDTMAHRSFALPARLPAFISFPPIRSPNLLLELKVICAEVSILSSF